MSLKDKLLDLSAHNWLHIVAAVCIGILLYQNHHQKLLIEQQEVVGKDLSARVMRDTITAVAEFLHKRLLLPYQFKEGEYRCRYGGKSQFSQIVTYSYALPEEIGRELLSREEQFRDRLARDFFNFRKVQPEWHFGLREGIHPSFIDHPTSMTSDVDKLLPPGYKWYTAEIEFSLPEFPVTD